MSIDAVTDWEKAKEEFFKLTGEKKPRETVAKFFSTSHTGLTKTIAACSVEWLKRHPKDKTAKNYTPLKANFESAANKYCTTLQELIDAEAKKTVVTKVYEGNKVVTEKWKTDSYRGLKMLKAKLEGYKASFAKQLEDIAQGERLTAQRGKEEMSQLEQSFRRMQEAEKSFRVGLVAGYKRLQAAVQAVKATPTVAVWNREFGDSDGARSLTTHLGLYDNFEKMVRKVQEKQPQLNANMTQEQMNLLNVTKRLRVRLDPWANGDRKTLPLETTEAEILKELKIVSALGKEAAQELGIG